MIKTLFIGTGEFAVPFLEGLFQDEFCRLVGVVTQPDKPIGRGQKLEGGAVKQFAGKRIQLFRSDDCTTDVSQIPVYQPAKLKTDSKFILDETDPDIIIVAAYGQMIPDSMLEFPKYGVLNIHASLLPVLRGAVPVQMTILQGLEETGVTIQKMVSELDAGPILAVANMQITKDETTEMLMRELSLMGRDLLLQILPEWVAGGIDLEEQDHTKATYCVQSDISKDKAEIRFDTPIDLAGRMVRAFYPWPVAWFKLTGKRVKVFKAEVSKEIFPETEGLAVQRRGKRLFLKLQDGILELIELQLEGKKRRNATEYLFLAANQ